MVECAMEGVDKDESITRKRMRDGSFTEQSSAERTSNQSTTLRLSFVNSKDSFVNIKWIAINDALNFISMQWDFIAFGSDHKSALIKTNCYKAVEQFKEIGGLEIDENKYELNVVELKTLNKRGIIYNKFLIPLTDDEILDALIPQGIKEIFRISKVHQDNGLTYFTGSVIIISENTIIPEFVWFGKIKICVSHMAPKPMSCEHCGLFGHKKLKCKRKDLKLCNICFYSHDEFSSCNKVCRNCNGNHYSQDKSCTQLEKEKKILKIRETHDISYSDAKEIFINSSPSSFNLEESSSSSGNKSKFQELIEKNDKLFNSLRIEREENKRISEELEEANLEIVVLKDRFEGLKEVNIELQIQLETQQELLNSSLNRNQIEIKEVSDKNIEAIKQNNSLVQKNKDLQNKIKLLERNSSTQQKDFQDFIGSSESISNAFRKYEEKKKTMKTITETSSKGEK